MTDLFADRTWFAVLCRWEKGMAELAKAKLLQQAYGVFLPMCLVLRKPSRTWIKVERPLFPRFLFCGVELDQAFRPILSTPGVECVLRGASEIPIEVPKRDLREIKARVDADGGAVNLVPPPPSKRWKKGQELLIQDGPFAGYTGEFLSADENRVKILLDILGRTTVVSVTAGQLAGETHAVSPAVAVETADV